MCLISSCLSSDLRTKVKPLFSLLFLYPRLFQLLQIKYSSCSWNICYIKVSRCNFHNNICILCDDPVWCHSMRQTGIPDPSKGCHVWWCLTVCRNCLGERVLFFQLKWPACSKILRCTHSYDLFSVLLYHFCRLAGTRQITYQTYVAQSALTHGVFNTCLLLGLT